MGRRNLAVFAWCSAMITWNQLLDLLLNLSLDPLIERNGVFQFWYIGNCRIHDFLTFEFQHICIVNSPNPSINSWFVRLWWSLTYGNISYSQIVPLDVVRVLPSIVYHPLIGLPRSPQKDLIDAHDRHHITPNIITVMFINNKFNQALLTDDYLRVICYPWR